MALQRAEEIRMKIAGQLLTYEGQQLGMITVSLGVSVFPEHGSNPTELLDKADKALYRAKGNGRNRVEAA